MSKKIDLPKDTQHYILNALRRATITWVGRRNALKKSRKKVVGIDGKKKLHWQCSICKCWESKQDAMEVDHIDEIGNYSGDLARQIEVMFNEGNLQVLCMSCHRKKTAVFNSSHAHKRININTAEEIILTTETLELE